MKELPVMSDLLSSKETQHHFHALVEALHPCLPVNAERVELLVPESETDAKPEVAIGEDVERGCVLSGVHRVQQREQKDAAPDTHLPGFCRDPAEQRPKLHRLEWLREEVLHHVYRFEARVATGSDLFKQLLGQPHRVLVRKELGVEDQAEFHLVLRVLELRFTARAREPNIGRIQLSPPPALLQRPPHRVRS